MKNLKFSDLVITDVKSIVEYLTCKICLGIYRNPLTISECNHSFCKSCILIKLHQTNQFSCPICKINLGSKPRDYLISDSSLERFVNIIFPKFKELEEIEEKNMYEFCRKLNFPLPDDTELKKNENDTILILEPFKNERPDLILPSIPSKQIKICSMMNIEILKKYIKNKIDAKLDTFNQIEVLYRNQIMHDNYSFRDIKKIYGGFDEESHTIFYYYKKN